MRRFLFLIVAAGATALPARAQQPDSSTTTTLQVSLDEAIRRSLEVQPAVMQSEGAIRNADATHRASLGSFLPSVAVSASASRGSQSRFDQTSQRIIPPIWNYGTGLAASVNLFTGLNRLWTLRSTAANADAADAGNITQRYQTTLQTKQVFYNAIATDDLVRVAEAQVRRTQQELDVAVQKLHAGSATRSDSLRAAVDFGNARIALLPAQANLGRQIGVDQPVRAVPDSILSPLPDTAALRAGLLESAPQVLQADAQARAGRAGVWSARSQYFPTLSLSYNASRRDTLFANALVANPSHTWSFGVQWTLFNGLTREQSQVSANVARDIAESQAADTRRMVSAQLTQQLAALETAFQQIDIAAVNVSAAQEDLHVQQERYRVGASTILDLLTSEANLTTAQTNLVQARFNYNIARAQLEALVGRSL